MNRKKWIYLAAGVIIVLLAVVLIRFGVDWSTPVGVIYRDGRDESNAQFRTALEASLRAQGYELIVVQSQSDPQLQLTQVEELAQQHCCAIIVEPVEENVPEALLEALQSTGLPAVISAQQPSQLSMEEYPHIQYVGSGSGEQIGAEQGSMVRSLENGGDINGDGVVCYMIIQGPEEDPDAAARTEAFEAALQSGSVPTQRLSIDYGDWTEESGKAICSQELAIFGMDIEVIACGNDAMARGAAQAIADGGWQVGQDVYLFGVDGDTQALSLIQEGLMTGTVYQDVQAQAVQICTQLENLLSGQESQSRSTAGIAAVTQDNVEQILE